MTKILIEIDTDTQRVVPVEPTVKILCAGRDTPCETTGDDAVDAPEDYRRVYRAMLAAAPQPEPVDADLRRDAELWRAHQKRKQLSVVKDCDDRYFAYDLSSEKIGPQCCLAETVTIDASMLSQGE